MAKISSEAVGRERWRMLAVVYVALLAFAAVFQALPPVLRLLIEELDISHAQAGSLMSLAALPGIFLAIPGGFLTDRYGVKQVGVLTLILLFLGSLIVALGNNYWMLAAGRIVTGIGAMVLMVLIPQAIAQWFQGREMGIAMGLFNTAMPVGSILSFNLLPLLGKNFGWRAAVTPAVFVAFIALLLFLFFYRSAPREKVRQSYEGKGLWSDLQQGTLPVWLIGLAWMWFNAALLSLTTFSPDLFVQRGYDIGFAGFLASFVMWGSLPLSPLVGYLTDKFKVKELSLALGGIGLAVFILLVYNYPSGTVPLMILVGVSGALIPAPVFSLVPDVLPERKLGLGYGIITTCVNIGMVFGPYTVGLGRDLTGSYQASFIVMSISALLVTAMASLLILSRRRLRQRQPV